MSDNNTVFDDIMQGLHEIEEHQKGNIKLKSHTVIISDEDYNIKYNQLPKDKQEVIKIIIDDMLKASSH